jgi:hypothetical protein
VEQLEGQDGEQAGAGGRVGRPDGVHRRLQDGDPLPVGDPEDRRLAARAVRDGGPRESLDVAERAGVAGGGEQGLAMRDVAGAALRLAEGDEQADP